LQILHPQFESECRLNFDIPLRLDPGGMSYF
jgi:hypothetical protein